MRSSLSHLVSAVVPNIKTIKHLRMAAKPPPATICPHAQVGGVRGQPAGEAERRDAVPPQHSVRHGGMQASAGTVRTQQQGDKYTSHVMCHKSSHVSQVLSRVTSPVTCHKSCPVSQVMSHVISPVTCHKSCHLSQVLSRVTSPVTCHV